MCVQNKKLMCRLNQSRKIDNNNGLISCPTKIINFFLDDSRSTCTLVCVTLTHFHTLYTERRFTTACLSVEPKGSHCFLAKDQNAVTLSLPPLSMSGFCCIHLIRPYVGSSPHQLS